jgi:Protein of unknown function (DUF2975)
MKNFQNKAKIVKVSTVLRILAFTGLILMALGTVVAFVNAILPPLFSKQFTFLFKDFTPIPMCAFAFLTNLKLFRFFDRLKKGFFFDEQTVGNLNAAGTWWLMMWLYGNVYSALGQTLNADPPWSDSINYSHFPADLSTLFAALTLKFFAWLFHEAQELQEEQELTV